MKQKELIRLSLVVLFLCGAAYAFVYWNYQRELSRGMQYVDHVRLVDAPGDPNVFRPVQVVNPLPPITEFDIVRASEVGERLNPAELVIGVTLNDEARAYPINMLNGPRREIINDTFGNLPIAATW